ncbi:MAG: Asp-tRNA(Asn)/Glu-tRNA(Gln) amidotransferase subunit GatB [Verrucomicrobiota bacterium]
MNYIPSIGLEVHCQIRSNTKMFCACPAQYGAPPNTLTCPVCLGLPGALPVLNEFAIQKTVIAGLLLDCKIPEVTKWDRKSYFYPDMPKNFQLSQFDQPLCDGGAVPLYDLAYPKDAQKEIANPGKTVALTRIHLEEDVAKSTHHANHSTIDFNRAGTPLMEIVSEPEIASPEEAVAYLNSLRQILVYGDISDADMEKGQLRCDVNISVRPENTEELGAKIELKNLNSTSAVRRALKYEIKRQTEALEQGRADEIIQSTRRWDDDQGITTEMRTKEDAHDYRYFPEPDLLPVHTKKYLDQASRLPELPHQKIARFESDYKITHYDASVLAADQSLAAYFEDTLATADSLSPKKAANFIINTLLGALNEREITITACPLSPQSLAALLALIESGQISNNQAKEDLLPDLFEHPDKDPAALAKEKGFEPADTGAIEALVDEAIAAHPDKVEEIKAGNEKLLNFLTGQVMKASKGKANPKIVTDTLRSKLL